jgi:hypothetical protein
MHFYAVASFLPFAHSCDSGMNDDDGVVNGIFDQCVAGKRLMYETTVEPYKQFLQIILPFCNPLTLPLCLVGLPVLC